MDGFTHQDPKSTRNAPPKKRGGQKDRGAAISTASRSDKLQTIIYTQKERVEAKRSRAVDGSQIHLNAARMTKSCALLHINIENNI